MFAKNVTSEVGALLFLSADAASEVVDRLAAVCDEFIDGLTRPL